jgi:sortase A
MAYMAMWVSLFIGLFIAYQLWGTAIYSSRAQTSLEQRFDSLSAVVPDLVATAVATRPVEPAVDAATDTAPEEAADSPSEPERSPDALPESTVPPGRGPLAPEPVPMDPRLTDIISKVVNARAGEVIARVEFPRLGVSHMVVEGVGADSLREGPGRYSSTAYLGGSGNAAIAGHRSTYGSPFGDLDALTPGDEIIVDTPLGIAVYQVMDPRVAFSVWIDRVREVGPGYVIVGPDDGFVLADVGDDRLTLTACHPRFSASERIIVAARLVTAPLAMLAPGFGAVEFDLAQLQLDRPVRQAGDRGPSNTANSSSTNGSGTNGSGTNTSRPSTVSPGTADPAQVLAAPVAQVSDLREGLSGVSAELLPTLVWSLLLLVAMAAGTVVKHHYGAVVSTLAGVIPIAGILWMLFNHLDRLLPAY